ncbi:hypothetical protein GLAREA_08603 [Glarea lozoyensis ATCC 20868]|uniref:BTB domain-containing protein n=1 Tax=Glarea lozoyensis (strain ATCC 20868 / MF5171) TaxID=1116229 RepID=S3CFQ3_GLAL2|nr:uncharacterized protein GLAREA_08603 [Glarea lozoyensis ATCC 20868]EPE24750.1 hypothetical protein GLAREA_08603 [Glarea lozoyensis ATCC 20868]
MAEPPKKKLKISMESFTVEPLKVIVGAEKRVFFINKDLICAQSVFFETACKKEWFAGLEHTVTLAEEDPIIFGKFLVWLSTGDIEGMKELLAAEQVPHNSAVESPENCARKAKFKQLVSCYILGDSLQCTRFQNCLINSICCLAKKADESGFSIVWDDDILQTTYNNIIAKSPLRKFSLDSFLSQDQKAISAILELNGKKREKAKESKSLARKKWKNDREGIAWMNELDKQRDNKGNEVMSGGFAQALGILTGKMTFNKAVPYINSAIIFRLSNRRPGQRTDKRVLTGDLRLAVKNVEDVIAPLALTKKLLNSYGLVIGKNGILEEALSVNDISAPVVS